MPAITATTERFDPERLRRHLTPARPGDRSEPEDGSVPAAVLVPLLGGPAPGVLLTRRAAALSNHAGQVCFPGGRIDPGDAGPEEAALREAFEEIGLDPACVTVLGRLADHRTGTGFLITPIVGIVTQGAPMTADPREVAEIFSLPLSTVLDPAAPTERIGDWQGRTRRYWVWPHAEHHIWGATAAILMELAAVLRGA